jgi:small multidrug resistance pump
MKFSDGFTKLGPSILLFVCYGTSLSLMTYALKVLDLGSAYATWSAIGCVFSTTIGIVFFNEQISAGKIASIIAIVISIASLRYFDSLLENSRQEYQPL